MAGARGGVGANAGDAVGLWQVQGEVYEQMPGSKWGCGRCKGRCMSRCRGRSGVVAGARGGV